MKASFKQETEPPFKPLKFEFTVENVEELLELWHRLNIPFRAVNMEYVMPTHRAPKEDISCCEALWESLDIAIQGVEL